MLRRPRSSSDTVAPVAVVDDAPVAVPPTATGAPLARGWLATQEHGAIVVKAEEGTYALSPDQGWLFSPVAHAHLSFPVATAETLVWLNGEAALLKAIEATKRHLRVVA